MLQAHSHLWHIVERYHNLAGECVTISRPARHSPVLLHLWAGWPAGLAAPPRLARNRCTTPSLLLSPSLSSAEICCINLRTACFAAAIPV